MGRWGELVVGRLCINRDRLFVEILVPFLVSGPWWWWFEEVDQGFLRLQVCDFVKGTQICVLFWVLLRLQVALAGVQFLVCIVVEGVVAFAVECENDEICGKIGSL